MDQNWLVNSLGDWLKVEPEKPQFGVPATPECLRRALDAQGLKELFLQKTREKQMIAGPCGHSNARTRYLKVTWAYIPMNCLVGAKSANFLELDFVIE